MDRVTVALASANVNKLHELRALLPHWDLQLLDADEYPEEEGETFYENARAKAMFAREVADPDLWVLGEDSGLEVKALSGGPGLHSARFAGPGATDEDNVAKLLDALRGLDDEGRRARYVSELVLLSPELEEFRGTGILEGRISSERRGSEGFGYDPIFVPERYDLTVAELGNEWKAENSHRAEAARALLAAVGEAAEAV
jgi:XTP/dITP diphosphohydrolase